MQQSPHEKQPFTAEDVELLLKNEIDESSKLGRRMMDDLRNDPDHGTVALILKKFNSEAVEAVDKKLELIFKNTMRMPIQRNVQQSRNAIRRRLKSSRDDEPKTGENM